MENSLYTTIESMFNAGIHINFWLMNLCVSLMTLLSAFYSEKFIHKNNSDPNIMNNIIYIPDCIFGNTEKNKTNNKATPNKKEDTKYIKYLVLNIIYFLIMLGSVITMKNYPNAMAFLQHLAILFIITLYFLQFIKPSIAIPVSVLYTVIWFASLYTSYRWIINNTVVLMCILMTGYIQFRNFIYLQIFMWIAFIYDVYLLTGIHVVTNYGSEIFSYKQDEISPTSSIHNLCENLLCTLFNHNHNYALPTVFSIQIGDETNHVFIGTGDIIIGAFVANFALNFFKSRKYLFCMVIMYSTSLALLSQVDETPFPALLSIVPICSVTLLVLGLFSRRSSELVLDKYPNEVEERTISMEKYYHV